MRHGLLAIGVVAAVLLSAGCVGQQRYDKLKLANQKQKERLAELRSRIKKVQAKIDRLEGKPSERAELISELEKELSNLRAELKKKRQKYRRLKKQQPEKVALPQPVDEALRKFAKEHSDLVEYKPSMGMVKFRSDLTFGLGSAQLSEKARGSLREFAKILLSPKASDYEARVVGHTDSVPIVQESTKQKHPTQWHLSIHRAIAVRDALENAGVPPVRTSVKGYSMYRPLVENDPKQGAKKNRRVEIFLDEMRPVDESLIAGDGRSEASGSSESESSGGEGERPRK